MADNRITHNEHRKEAPRNDRTPYDRGGRLLSPSRVERSPFQKLLDKFENGFEQTDQPSTPYTTSREPNAAQTREAAKPVLAQQDRYGRDKDEFEKKLVEKESDHEEGRSVSSKDSGLPRAREAERRVIARSSVSDRKHQGHSQGEGEGMKNGHFGQGKKGKGFDFSLEKSGLRKGKMGELTRGEFALELAGSPAAPKTPEKGKTPPSISKALLDQLVRYCRLVTKTDGDKEFDLQLHEEVFKGLRLRVSLIGGKMEVTFLTSSQDVLGLFQAQSADLRNSLSEKGIDVRRINVIMV